MWGHDVRSYLLWRGVVACGGLWTVVAGARHEPTELAVLIIGDISILSMILSQFLICLNQCTTSTGVLTPAEEELLFLNHLPLGCISSFIS